MQAQGQVIQRKSSAWLMWIVAGLLCITSLGLGWYALNTMPVDPGDHRFTQPYEYYLYIPKAYMDERSWPVFVGIHGSGGSGLDCWNSWQSFADKEGFVLVCPSLADAGGGWYQEDGEWKVNAILSQVRGEYNLDGRLYLAGFSAGAQFVQGYAFRYSQSVKGVAVLSPGNYYTPTMSAWGIPFLVVTGEREIPRRLDAAQQLVSLLEQNNFTVAYHLLPGVGHTLTNEARKLTIELFREVNGK